MDNQQQVSNKYPLQSKWTFWYDKKPNKSEDKDYKEQLVKLGTFNTLTDFASYYAFLSRPSNLSKNAKLHLFREEIPPMWETELLDRLWEQLIFATIAEEFEEPDVVGVNVSIRSKEDVLSVWNKDVKNSRAMYAIGERLKRILHLGPSVVVSYKYNKSSMKDRSTFRNAKNYIIVDQQKK